MDLSCPLIVIPRQHPWKRAFIQGMQMDGAVTITIQRHTLSAILRRIQNTHCTTGSNIQLRNRIRRSRNRSIPMSMMVILIPGWSRKWKRGQRQPSAIRIRSGMRPAATSWLTRTAMTIRRATTRHTECAMRKRSQPVTCIFGRGL